MQDSPKPQKTSWPSQYSYTAILFGTDHIDITHFNTEEDKFRGINSSKKFNAVKKENIFIDFTKVVASSDYPNTISDPILENIVDNFKTPILITKKLFHPAFTPFVC